MPRKKQPFRMWFRKEYGYYYISFPDTPGKWISTSTPDKTEAIQFAKQYRPDLLDEKITFGEFTRNFYLKEKRKWLKRMISKGRIYGDAHLNRMRQLLVNYLQEEFGNIYIQNITRRMIDDYLIDLKSKRSKYTTPLLANTKKHIITVARNVFQEAVDLGLVKEDPTYGLSSFRDTETKERDIFRIEELKCIFPEEIARLKNIWLTFEWATYFYIQGSCGLRPGEVSALKWGDWHRNLHGLIISHSIENRTGNRKCTKTGIKKPAVLTKRAEGLLLLLESTNPETNSDSLIFHSPNGGPVLLETANKHFRSSCRKAGVDPRERTQYCLRHSFNTHALHMLETKEVQKLMGHKTNEMTRHYYHPTDEDLLNQVPESARKKLEDVW